jgi:hypothetical protein
MTKDQLTTTAKNNKIPLTFRQECIRERDKRMREDIKKELLKQQEVNSHAQT